MAITLTCASCGKQCQVKEEYAGMQVRCPNCPGVITVPMLAPSMPVVSSVPVENYPASPSAPPPAPGSPPPPMPASQAGPVFLENINKFLAANGITGLHKILMFVGVGCLAFFLVTVLLPWTPSVTIGGPSGGTITVGGALGITTPYGLLYFFGTLAITFLLVFVVLMGWNNLFSYVLWTSGNWAVFVSLNLLVLLRVAGVGQVIALLVMLGAAGTLGTVAFSRVFSAK